MFERRGRTLVSMHTLSYTERKTLLSEKCGSSPDSEEKERANEEKEEANRCGVSGGWIEETLRRIQTVLTCKIDHGFSERTQHEVSSQGSLLQAMTRN
jgi:hypothetical protein